MDVFDRSIVGLHIGLRCEAKHAVQALQQALMKRKRWDVEKKPVVRSDNGPQFVSHLFEETCKEWHIEHERIPPRTPNMNAHIESFHRWLEEDRLSQQGVETYAQAYEAVVDYMEFYNQRRIHSSLHYLAPMECHKRYMETGLQPKKTIRV